MSLTKWKSIEELVPRLRNLQRDGRRIVFTNGCFDLLHPGHVRYLREARNLGDCLVVGLNSDDSIRRLKGPARPVQPEAERAEILCALEMVDFVAIFHEDTPLQIIVALQPDVLVKGGDWQPDQIVGRTEVEARGGRVLSLPFADGFSTTSIIGRILGSR